MERYWNEEIETMSRDDMKKLQDERLQIRCSRVRHSTASHHGYNRRLAVPAIYVEFPKLVSFDQKKGLFFRLYHQDSRQVLCPDSLVDFFRMIEP